jgi:hypothetical protein
VGDCHGQSLLDSCGVQNSMRIVKVLKDNYIPRYCFSVLREL